MNLQGWIPAHFSQGSPASPRIDWMLMGRNRFTDPFFEDTLARQMRHPFHQLFRRSTTVDDLLHWGESHPGIPLRGLIFHMSRCGSTLLSRMLAAPPRHLVLSEPSPLDSAIRARHMQPAMTAPQHQRLMRAMLAALTQPRSGEEIASFIKLDAWDIHQFDAIHQAFPDTPWMFLYRDPVEVMVSHARMPGAWTVPGMIDIRALKLDPTEIDPARQDIYAARSLEQICEAALIASQEHGGLLMNYSELPEAFTGRLASFFDLDACELPAMVAAADQNAKRPNEAFQPDRKAKQEAANEQLHDVVSSYLRPVYQRLETLRRKQIAATWEAEHAPAI